MVVGEGEGEGKGEEAPAVVTVFGDCATVGNDDFGFVCVACAKVLEVVPMTTSNVQI